MRTVVLFSGGIDSYLAALIARDRCGDSVECLHVTMKVMPSGFDIADFRANELAAYLGLPLRSGLVSGGAVPATLDGPAGVVPGRNLLYLQLAAMQLAPDGGRVVLGCIADDWADYVDARPEVLEPFCAGLSMGMEMPLEVSLPLAEYKKIDVLHNLHDRRALAYALAETVSCYHGSQVQNEWGLGCGRCRSCKERRVAYETFAAALPGWREDPAAG